jgi:chemotaxis protein methyltransferase CheR
VSALSAADFEYIRGFIRTRSAIVLEPGKEYLVESRLTPVVRKEGLASIESLVRKLREGSANGLERMVVEAMTTNETSFFRDITPFEAMRTKIIPELIERRAPSRRLDIWSGACSSGQETYTMLMLLREHFPQLASWTVRVHATDLSTQMVERTRAGQYSQLEVNRGLPAAMLVKYFERCGDNWQVVRELRSQVEVRTLNLDARWSGLCPMDIVLMRNVLIYFDVVTKKEILGRVRGQMRPDGYLFLGSAETTIGLDDAFQRVQFDKASCYQLVGAAVAR